jgi:hypothetical protein
MCLPSCRASRRLTKPGLVTARQSHSGSRCNQSKVRTQIVLRLDNYLLNADLKTLAHLWKGRAHRKKADYEKAHEHIDVARDLACTLPDSQALIAIIQVQQGWLLFQR